MTFNMNHLVVHQLLDERRREAADERLVRLRAVRAGRTHHTWPQLGIALRRRLGRPAAASS